jgi:hypothetical protein
VITIAQLGCGEVFDGLFFDFSPHDLAEIINAAWL